MAIHKYIGILPADGASVLASRFEIAVPSLRLDEVGAQHRRYMAYGSRGRSPHQVSPSKSQQRQYCLEQP
jgi:hypothetical protein